MSQRRDRKSKYCGFGGITLCAAPIVCAVAHASLRQLVLSISPSMRVPKVAFEPWLTLGSPWGRNWIWAALFRLFGRGVAEITGRTRISTDFGVDNQFQTGIVVGLKAGVL